MPIGIGALGTVTKGSLKKRLINQKVFKYWPAQQYNKLKEIKISPSYPLYWLGLYNTPTAPLQKRKPPTTPQRNHLFAVGGNP